MAYSIVKSQEEQKEEEEEEEEEEVTHPIWSIVPIVMYVWYGT
jgi:hypothetical protein